MFENLPNVVTVKELSELLRISDQKVKRALNAGSLKGLRVGREWRIPKDEILKWVKTK